MTRIRVLDNDDSFASTRVQFHPESIFTDDGERMIETAWETCSTT